jgi:hypothetical protein
MIPGTYNLILVENSTNRRDITISGITTTSGYIATADIRAGNTPSSPLMLGLVAGSGLSLSAGAAGLTVSLLITEDQVDVMAPRLDNADAYWSLKLTTPTLDTYQYLAGVVSIVRTPTG